MSLLAGCSGDTYSQVDDPKPPTVSEKSPEELAQEAEEERIRLEEELRLARERELEEQRLLEEQRKVELGHFYVPLPAEEVDNPRVKAKAIYVTGHSVGVTTRFQDLMNMVDTTELNSMVIDVKNDDGKVMYQSNIEIIQTVGANTSYPIKDIQAVMTELASRNIYPIARIVVFRDPLLAEKRKDWAIQKKDGSGVWRDYARLAWVNPYEKNVWDYNIAVAKEAALMGFREIQFDYVRFPENAARVEREATFPGSGDLDKDEAIRDFLQYAKEQLKDYNVYLAADVFGVIATSWGDSDRIGQTWEKISPIVDYICPMVYPSHYGPGYFGFPVPDAQPAGTINRSMIDSIKRNAPISEPAIIRPWLQSFTATWIKGYIPYGPTQVRQQIEAALALGIDEFMIWNPGNRYSNGSFLAPDAAVSLADKLRNQREEKGQDQLGKTANQALGDYLEAVKLRRWRDAYVLQATGFRIGHDEYKVMLESWQGRLSTYTIAGLEGNQTKTFKVNAVINHSGKPYEINEQVFKVYLENGIWKVEPTEDFLALLSQNPEQEEQ
jgi:hypothetical protein